MASVCGIHTAKGPWMRGRILRWTSDPFRITLMAGILGSVLLSSGFPSVVGGQQPERSLPTEWILAQEPTLILGGRSGSGSRVSEGVFGAAWAPDGSALVAVAVAGEIQRFAMDGTHLGKIGRAHV